ncbi:MAG TPA: hypothetical protein VGH82_07310 [Gaiellaceae bacterium]
MSVFRPTVRLQDPDGRHWEIYAYKLDLGIDSADGRLLGRAARAARSLAASTIRSLRSDEWTIEAICYVPRESYRWRTTREFKGQVLARVEGSLARGDVPTRLTNALLVDWRRPR